MRPAQESILIALAVTATSTWFHNTSVYIPDKYRKLSAWRTSTIKLAHKFSERDVSLSKLQNVGGGEQAHSYSSGFLNVARSRAEERKLAG